MGFIHCSPQSLLLFSLASFFALAPLSEFLEQAVTRAVGENNVWIKSLLLVFTLCSVYCT